MCHKWWREQKVKSSLKSHTSSDQIIGIDVLELPKTECGNQYDIVFQDFLTKWPMVFATLDQRAIRIVRLLAEEIVPIFGVPECLLSNHGSNLLIITSCEGQM